MIPKSPKPRQRKRSKTVRNLTDCSSTVRNPTDMEGMLILDNSSDEEQERKNTKKSQISKPSSAVRDPAETEGMLTLDDSSDKEEVANDGAVPAKSKSNHHPDIYANLSDDQRGVVHDDAREDYKNFIKYNLPLGHTSSFILNNGRTMCPYHSITNLTAVNDFNPKSGQKVTGIAYPPTKSKKGLKDTSYLDRPLRVDAEGNVKPPKPNSYNPNFTLKRVLKFFPVSKDGIRMLHCGCALNEVLVDFSFWKRTTIISPSTSATDHLASPLRPRDRLYLCSILSHLDVKLDFLYQYDTQDTWVSAESRTLQWVDIMLARVDQGKAPETTKERPGPSKRRLEYVEISDEGKEDTLEKGKGPPSLPDIGGFTAGYRDKGKGKGREEDSENDHDIDPGVLYSDSASDSDHSNVRSPSSLKRLSELNLDNE
ncbi:hypothetical protein H1R20_g10641, partial [Candolleomyces eurysporus]